MPTPGWYPDPAGRHHFRFWDGARWSELVSTGGVTGTDPAEDRPEPGPTGPEPGPTGPEPVVVFAEPDGGYRMATASGVELARAAAATEGDEVVLRAPEGTGRTTLTLGARHVVVARTVDGAEIGRFEPAPGGGLRLVARGALAGGLVSWPDGTLGLVDPNGTALARFTFADGSTTVETAPGLAPALANLAALVPVAMALAHQLPTPSPSQWRG